MVSKRMTSLFLVFLMLISLAVPAVAENAQERPYYQPKILINMSIDPDIVYSNETAIGKVIEEKFNVVFEYIPMPGVLNDTVNMLLTTGDYPDLIGMSGVDNIRKYIDAGAAISLEEYLDDMPNFCKAYEEQIPLWRNYSDKGELAHWETGVGGDTSARIASIPSDLIVRSDALEACGWPELNSASDWTAFLKEAMEKLPETNGQATIGLTTTFAEAWGLQGIAAIGYEKGETTTADAGNNAVIWNHAENKFVDYFLNEESTESVKWFNQLYREGILDTECFTDLYQQTVDKTKSGRPIAVWYSGWASGEANAIFEEAGHPEMVYVSAPFQLDSQYEEGQRRNLRDKKTDFSEIYCITKNCEQPERIIEILEWACSEEGQCLLRGGVEGVTYNIVDGKRVITDEYFENWSNYTWKMPVGLAYEFRFLPSLSGIASDGVSYNLDSRELQLRRQSERNKQVITEMGWDKWYDAENFAMIEVDPNATGATIDTTSEASRIETQLIDFRVKAYARLIMEPTSDEEFDALYEELVEDYMKLQPEKVIEAYTAAYEANLAKNS